jgi:hypothetical protein
VVLPQELRRLSRRAAWTRRWFARWFRRERVLRRWFDKPLYVDCVCDLTDAMVFECRFDGCVIVVNNGLVRLNEASFFNCCFAGRRGVDFMRFFMEHGGTIEYT